MPPQTSGHHCGPHAVGVCGGQSHKGLTGCNKEMTALLDDDAFTFMFLTTVLVLVAFGWCHQRRKEKEKEK